MNTAQMYGDTPSGANAPQSLQLIMATVSPGTFQSIADFESLCGMHSKDQLTEHLLEETLTYWIEHIGETVELNKFNRQALLAFYAVASDAIKTVLTLRETATSQYN